jgi:hypothetical protein
MSACSREEARAIFTEHGIRDDEILCDALGISLTTAYDHLRDTVKLLDVIETLVEVAADGGRYGPCTVPAGTRGTLLDRLADGRWIVELGVGEDGVPDRIAVLHEAEFR